jgi:hypothetical protein
MYNSNVGKGRCKRVPELSHNSSNSALQRCSQTLININQKAVFSACERVDTYKDNDDHALHNPVPYVNILRENLHQAASGH